MPIQRLLAHEHRRQDGDEALLREPVERVAVQGEREPAGVADPVAEARAAHLRGAVHVEAAELEALLGVCELRRLADEPLDPDVLLRRAVGDVVGRRVRDAQADLVALVLGLGELELRALQLLLDPRSSSSCSGVGLPLTFVRERSSSTRGTSSRQRSSAASQASNASAGALAREAAPELVRLVAGGVGVDHDSEST